jgi:hypothetical protein
MALMSQTADTSIEHARGSLSRSITSKDARPDCGAAHLIVGSIMAIQKPGSSRDRFAKAKVLAFISPLLVTNNYWIIF